MSVKIKALSHFERRAKRLQKKYDTLIEDIAELSVSLKKTPMQGSNLGGGFYKIRMASQSKGKGKSGGFRVITYFVEQRAEGEVIYLVTIYDKSEQASISKKELSKILKVEIM